MGTSKPQRNGPLYSNTVIDKPTLAVDLWAVTFGTARRGMGGLRLRPCPSRYQKLPKFSKIMLCYNERNCIGLV